MKVSKDGKLMEKFAFTISDKQMQYGIFQFYAPETQFDSISLL